MYGAYWKTRMTSGLCGKAEGAVVARSRGKTRGETSPKYAESSFKEEGKKLLSLSVAIREKIILFVDLNFIREH